MKLKNLILVECFPSKEYFKIIEAKDEKHLRVDLKDKKWSLRYLIYRPMGMLWNRAPYGYNKELLGVYRKRKKDLKKMASDIYIEVIKGMKGAYILEEMKKEMSKYY